MKKKKYILYFILVFSWMMFSGITHFDFFWSYCFSFNIADGLIPYNDFNMVVMPFSALLFSIPLFIFGKSITIYAIFYSFLIVFLFYLLEKIYKDKSIILIFLLFNFILIAPIFITTCNYNLLMMIFGLSLIYIEKNNKSLYITGILLALALFTKQNIGFLFIFSVVIFNLKNRKRLFKIFISFILTVVIFVIYLICTNSLYNFLDQTILGLFNFGTDNNLFFGVWYYLSIIMFLIELIYVIRCRTLENWLLFSLSFLTTPGYDYTHFIMGFSFFILLMVKNMKFNISKNFHIYILVAQVLLLGSLITTNFKREHIYPTGVKYFNYFYHPKDVILENRMISKYIKDNKYKSVVIFASNSYYYKISNGYKINKYLDLMNNGNYGHLGSKCPIGEINSLDKNTIYLYDSRLLDEFDPYSHSQLDTKTLKYFLRNSKKIDKIGKFDVYKFIGKDD